jgi:hypothetical protein
MSRRRGRPPLDPAEASVNLCLRLPGSRFKALAREATDKRTTVSALVRQSLQFRNEKLGTRPTRR